MGRRGVRAPAKLVREEPRELRPPWEKEVLTLRSTEEFEGRLPTLPPPRESRRWCGTEVQWWTAPPVVDNDAAVPKERRPPLVF